jgi:hypothetical protein
MAEYARAHTELAPEVFCPHSSTVEAWRSSRHTRPNRASGTGFGTAHVWPGPHYVEATADRCHSPATLELVSTPVM